MLGLVHDVDPRPAVDDKNYVSKANRRTLIEQAVGKLKRFKRAILRCEKTRRNFAAIVALAAAFVLVKSAYTA